jgi:16S rRNA (cytosine967-C5)-methyltransferase
VKPGGRFLYITCSVFRKENEEVVEHLKGHAGLQLEEMKYLEGYGERADTLFAARFISPA